MNARTPLAGTNHRNDHGPAWAAKKGIAMQSTRLWACVAVAAMGLTVGCAEPVEDIDRVQPNYVEKGLFIGDWFYRQTIVDVPPEVAIGNLGVDTALEKIRWEVTEDYLIAYRTHESVLGLAEDDTLEGHEFQGDPVAIYTIESHFDIRRSYNAATGEENNVIVENKSDRPWYEREYMRVDWASNSLINRWDFAGFYSMIYRELAGATYWGRFDESTRFDPDQLVIEDDFMQWTTVHALSDGGYGCFYTYGTFNCGSAEVKVRQSFAKINQDDLDKFEPRLYMDNIEGRDEDNKLIRTISFNADALTIPSQDTRTRGEGEACRNPAECQDNLTCIQQGESGICATDCQTSDECGEGRICAPSRQGGPGECSPLIVDFACTQELMDFINDELVGVPNYYKIADDCYSPIQFEQFERFGWYRTERYDFDRRVGIHDDNRRFYANVHNVWKTAYELDENGKVRRDEDGDKIRLPMSEREVQPIVYYLNVNFPEDLKPVAAQIGRDWNEAFAEMAVVGTGKSRDDVESQIEQDMKAAEDGVLVTWLDHLDRENNEETVRRQVFQVRENNCSVTGVSAYIEKNPQMLAIVQDAVENPELDVDGVADALLPGNIEGICAGLRRDSYGRKGVDHFVWQQVGDARFSFVYWVNEPNPDGPLGFGPLSADPETGQVISGNAYVYGAAIDTYARSAADVVRALNEDLDINELISGQNYLDWLEGTKSVADMEFELAPAPKAALDARFSQKFFKDVEEKFSFAGLDPRHSREAAMANILKRGAGYQELVDSDLNEGRAHLERLKQDPRIADRFLTRDALAVVRPYFPDVPRDQVTPELRQAALDMTMTPDAFDDFQRERQQFFADRNMLMADFLDDSIIGQALEMKGMNAEDVYHELRRQIFRAVMLHELGHTVGMTHNFQGSMDPLNYQPEYWQIRSTLDEADWNKARLAEYRYSTIMDYGARFNSDTKGLGFYDKASIKFVYGHQAEVFAEDVPVPVYYDADLMRLFHGYEHIPRLLGDNIENLWKRDYQPIEEAATEEFEGLMNNTRMLLAGGEGISPTEWWVSRAVPYSYCFDSYRYLDCRTWDEGANHTEAVRSAIQRYWNYYVFNAYRRNRSESGFINGFFGRQSRLRDSMSYPFRYWYFYQYSSLALSDDMRDASLLALNFVNQVLGTPEPGHHCYDDATGTYVPAVVLSDGTGMPECADALEVEIGDGRHPDIRYNDEYYYQIDYIGSHFDKMEFMYTIFSTETSFFRVADVGDSRRYLISYWRIFRPELVRIIHDMILGFLGEETAASYAAVVNDKGEVQPPLVVDPATFGTNLPSSTDGMSRVRAPVSYNMAWYAMLLASVFSTSTNDQQADFSEYITILERGSGNDRDLVDGIETVDFTHPETGVVYSASQTSDGMSISFDLLERVNRLVTEYEQISDDLELEENQGNEEMVRRHGDVKRRIDSFTEFFGDLRLLRSVMDYGTRQ